VTSCLHRFPDSERAADPSARALGLEDHAERCGREGNRRQEPLHHVLARHSTAERFNYLYTREELKESARALRELDREAETVYAMFNNNGRSPANEVPKHLRGEADRQEIAQAPTNATMLKEVLTA
jgi:uncharacterized protein YecE (DUF72 family)